MALGEAGEWGRGRREWGEQRVGAGGKGWDRRRPRVGGGGGKGKEAEAT